MEALQDDLKNPPVKRLYTQGANKKGDLAEPMRQTKDWIIEKFN